MKKLLSILLASAMAASLSVTAFALGTSETIIDYVGTTGGDSAGTLAQGEDDDLENFTASDFQVDDGFGSPTNISTLTADVLKQNGFTVGTTSGYFEAYFENDGGAGVDIMVYAKPEAKVGVHNFKVNMKWNKQTSNVAVWNVTVTVTAGATVVDTTVTSGYKITGVNEVNLPDIYDATIRPDEAWYMRLSYDMFTWETNDGVEVTDADILTNIKLTSALMNRYKVYAKRTVTKGSQWIDEIDIVNYNDGAAVEIQFLEDFVTVSEPDFDATIYLQFKTTRVQNTDGRFTGTISNYINEVNSDDDYATANGAIVKAVEAARNVKIDGGNDVYAYHNLNSGGKYYFKAKVTTTSSDDTLISENPSIEEVIAIYQINLGNAKVLLDGYDAKMYVYDANGKYLGTSDEKVAMSSKYYVSTKKIDLDATAEDDDVTDTVTEAPVETPTNESSNPDTGVNGLVNVAVVAGVAALAVAGAVASKK